MIHDEIVTFEVAKLAKEKGFPQDVDRWLGDLHSATSSNYYNHKGELNGDCIEIIKCKIQKEETPKEFELVAAPTQSLLQRWLREEKDVQIIITPSLDELGAWRWGHYGWVVYIYNEYQPIYYSRFNRDNFWTYEKSLEDALKYALKNLI